MKPFRLLQLKRKTDERLYVRPCIRPDHGLTLGTALGSVIGSVLPEAIGNAMGIALYAMFIAIIIPPAKRSKPVLNIVLISIGINLVLKYVPFLGFISSGFRVILATIAGAGIGASLWPVTDNSAGVAQNQSIWTEATYPDAENIDCGISYGACYIYSPGFTHRCIQKRNQIGMAEIFFTLYPLCCTGGSHLS